MLFVTFFAFSLRTLIIIMMIIIIIIIIHNLYSAIMLLGGYRGAGGTDR